MNLSRIFRGPLFWIIIGIFALFLVLDLARGADAPRRRALRSHQPG